jgi:predicted ester cyclase
MVFLQIFQKTKKVLNSSSIFCGKDFLIRITFEDIIVEGDKVACRYNLAGTHKGEFMDIKPTNKQFRVNGMTIFSFRNAKVIERWNLVDMMSLMEQLKT